MIAAAMAAPRSASLRRQRARTRRISFVSASRVVVYSIAVAISSVSLSEDGRSPPALRETVRQHRLAGQEQEERYQNVPPCRLLPLLLGRGEGLSRSGRGGPSAAGGDCGRQLLGVEPGEVGLAGV